MCNAKIVKRRYPFFPKFPQKNNKSRKKPKADEKKSRFRQSKKHFLLKTRPKIAWVIDY